MLHVYERNSNKKEMKCDSTYIMTITNSMYIIISYTTKGDYSITQTIHMPYTSYMTHIQKLKKKKKEYLSTTTPAERDS